MLAQETRSGVTVPFVRRSAASGKATRAGTCTDHGKAILALDAWVTHGRPARAAQCLVVLLSVMGLLSARRMFEAGDE
jgi:hypothetical protein